MKRSFIIYKYSLLNKLKSKSFLIITAILAIVLIGSTLAMTFFGTDYIDNMMREKITVGIISDELLEEDLDYLTARVAGLGTYALELVEEQGDFEKTTYFYDVANNELYTNQELSFEVKLYFERLALETSLLLESKADNISNEVTQHILDSSQYKVVYSDEMVSGESFAINIVGTFLTIFTMILIVLGINGLGLEIVEEKASRAMEIIITSVKAQEHLVAKVLSMTTYNILLVLEIVIFGFIGLSLSALLFFDGFEFSYLSDLGITEFIMANIEIAPFRVIMLIILLFIGLIIVLFFAGMIAALSNSSENYNKLITPIMMAILSSYMVGIIVQDITFNKYASLIPVLNIFTAQKYFLYDGANIWIIIGGVLSSLIFLLVSFMFTIKIYREGILNYSTQSFKKVYRQAFPKK